MSEVVGRRTAASPRRPAARSAGPSNRALQAKLTVGRRDDPLEREADRAADRVLAGGTVGALGTAGPGAQRACAACEGEETETLRRQPIEEEEELLQPKAAAGGVRPAGLGPGLGMGGAEAAGAALRSGGRPLPSGPRAYFEPRFGRDLSGVRIHDHTRASAGARAIGARAYTLGSDIAFAAGAYAPESRDGRRLIAHELAHVAQQRNGAKDGALRRAAPQGKGQQPAPEAETPSDELTFTKIDFFVYPLIVDIWNDIFGRKLTDKQKAEFKRKGKEGAAIWNFIAAGPFAGASLEGEADFGDFMKAWTKHAEELHRIAGGGDLYLDLFGTFVNFNIEAYLGSDLFLSRLKSHASSLITIFGVAQGILSSVQGATGPSAKLGEFEPSQWEKQTDLVKILFNLILKEQIKAPDFFAIGPLKLATHPAFAATSATAGGAPKELTFELAKGGGEGQGGERTKLGLTLNLPQIVGMFGEGGPSASDIANLQKYRGWQGSVWFSYQKTDPTALQRQAGKLPSKAFHAGTLFGGGGFLGQIEGGGRYGGDEARELTAWFLRGGGGYSGKKGDVIQKMGFNAIYTDWTERDILAPRLGEGGAPLGGQAGRITPFTKLEFGERHRFGVGAALSFVTGTHETFDVSNFRGDFSYTYMGDRSKDALPVFKLDLSGSVGRLDWWNPDSPLMTGIGARASVNQFFAAGQLNMGAGDIPEARADLLGGTGGDKGGDKVKALVPNTVMFTGGVMF